jgi:hypothetical protein
MLHPIILINMEMRNRRTSRQSQEDSEDFDFEVAHPTPQRPTASALSFDWDNFATPNANEKEEEQWVSSGGFGKSKRATSQRSFDKAEDSRDIMEISVRGPHGVEQGSFRFERESMKPHN